MSHDITRPRWFLPPIAFVLCFINLYSYCVLAVWAALLLDGLRRLHTSYRLRLAFTANYLSALDPRAMVGEDSGHSPHFPN